MEFRTLMNVLLHSDSNRLPREPCVEGATSVHPLIVMNHKCDVTSDKMDNNFDSDTVRHS
jgi:hypothetical protein